jgi:hypothetical protein
MRDVISRNSKGNKTEIRSLSYLTDLEKEQVSMQKDINLLLFFVVGTEIP